MICRRLLGHLSPEAGQRIHGWMMDFWLLNLILVWFMAPDWRIPYLVVVSIYANFVGHWGGLSAERPTEIVDGD